MANEHTRYRYTRAFIVEGLLAREGQEIVLYDQPAEGCKFMLTGMPDSLLADADKSTAAGIVLWNTVYLERAIQALRNQGQMIPEALLVHLSPLKWEHINLIGDYHWRRDGGLRNRKLRPLRNAFAPPTALP
jgi:hypothetical protein